MRLVYPDCSSLTRDPVVVVSEEEYFEHAVELLNGAYSQIVVECSGGNCYYLSANGVNSRLTEED